MDLIRALWRGEVSLAKTYWLFGFCVNVLLIISVSYISYNEQLLSTVVGIFLCWMFIGISLIYSPFILISTWRSANKYIGPNAWAILAKIMVIVGWGSYFKGIREELEALKAFL
jgi:hypothetical protein